MGQHPVIIIGAGISGLSLGHQLVKQGRQVVVLDAGQIASGASGAAAAYLEPRTGTGGLRAIEWASLEVWPDFAASIERATGRTLDYRTEGLMHVAFEDGLARLQQDFEKRCAAGTPTTWLSGEEARALEPQLAPDIAAGYLLDQVNWLDGPELCAGLADVVRSHGGQIHEHTSVDAVTDLDGLIGVSAGGSQWTTDTLAVCCAMGRNHIAGLPDDVPLCRPVRGVMLSLPMRPEAPLTRRVIKHSKGIVCPRSNGHIMVGPTSERGETSLVVDDQVKRDLLETAARFVPALSGLPVSEVNCGVRALVGDGTLKLGQSRQRPGVYFSLSHGGSGYLRAPVVAEELAAYMLDEHAPCPLTSPYLARLS